MQSQKNSTDGDLLDGFWSLGHWIFLLMLLSACHSKCDYLLLMVFFRFPHLSYFFLLFIFLTSVKNHKVACRSLIRSDAEGKQTLIKVSRRDCEGYNGYICERKPVIATGGKPDSQFGSNRRVWNLLVGTKKKSARLPPPPPSPHTCTLKCTTKGARAYERYLDLVCARC